VVSKYLDYCSNGPGYLNRRKTVLEQFLKPLYEGAHRGDETYRSGVRAIARSTSAVRESAGIRRPSEPENASIIESLISASGLDMAAMSTR